MSQEIEIEFKNMLTKQEFKNIASALQLTEKILQIKRIIILIQTASR